MACTVPLAREHGAVITGALNLIKHLESKLNFLNTEEVFLLYDF